MTKPEALATILHMLQGSKLEQVKGLPNDLLLFETTDADRHVAHRDARIFLSCLHDLGIEADMAGRRDGGETVKVSRF